MLQYHRIPVAMMATKGTEESESICGTAGLVFPPRRFGAQSLGSVIEVSSPVCNAFLGAELAGQLETRHSGDAFPTHVF